MKISDYKKRKLQWYNRLINAFLILGLSLVLILLLTLTVSESTIKHFEDNAENLSSELASVVIENVDDMLSDDDIQDVMVEHNLDELPEGDLCEYSDQIETDDEDVLFVFERECANGSLDRETMIDAVLDVKMDSFEEDAAVQIAESLGETITDAGNSIDELKEKSIFLNLYLLIGIFVLLLILYLINNDLLILSDYIARKLVFFVSAIFIFPYILAKTNALGWVFGKLDLSKIVGGDIPIDPQKMITKIVSVLSDQLASFYSQYLLYAIIAIVVGLLLWLANANIFLPFFAKKLNGKKLEDLEKKKKELETKK